MLLEQTAKRECTLFVFLHHEMRLSSKLIKKLKWKNALLVNGEPRHTDYRVQPGDRVSVGIEEHADGFAPEELALDVLYEDAYLIALDKPAGMLVHPSACRNDGTLANGLLHYYNSTGQPCAVHPVSRLDRDTLGVVLFAKSAHVHALLCRMHREHQLLKTYHAVCFGCPAAESGTIELPIRKLGDGSLLRVVDPSGQYAKTEYRVLSQNGAFSFLQLHPVTGRTHQLRLHCMAGGFPILGDPQYRSDASAACSERLGLSTQQLCAWELTFPHPMTGEMLTVRSKRRLFLPETKNFSENG